jgi:large subunit ribosomal protein L29
MVLKARDIREMGYRERRRTLIDLREELMMLYSTQTGGGVSDNPAKAKMLRKQIARILTVMNEEQQEEEEEIYEEL